MLLIKDIEVHKVKGPMAEVISTIRDDIGLQNGDMVHFNPRIINEVVHGQCFANADGERVYIGATLKVQKALRLPFEVFNNQSNTIDRMHGQIRELVEETKYLKAKIEFMQNCVAEHLNMNLWQRFMFVIKGMRFPQCHLPK